MLGRKYWVETPLSEYSANLPGGPITFAAVCQEAHVSKTFLYDAHQADLAAQIRRLRDLPPTRGNESRS